jgi:O-methyltransferase
LGLKAPKIQNANFQILHGQYLTTPFFQKVISSAPFMKRTIINASIFLKQLIIFLRPHVLLGWLRHPLLTLSNTLSMTRWMSQQNKNKDIFNDFYSARRVYSKRLELFEYVSNKFSLHNQPVDYLEFGVAGGHSFKWWMEKCAHSESRFYGFDTFEGLPESWGAFKKGDMNAELPSLELEDKRGKYIKGLFQDSVPGFLKNTSLNNGKRKVIHLDADLFSSTLFALTSLAPHIKPGDILLFDEFNVPNHEYYAFRMFSESYYFKTTLVAAVNNYYQVAFVIG